MSGVVVGEADDTSGWGGVVGCLGFGMLVGVGTYVLHGVSLLDRAPSTVSGWMLWAALSGAMIAQQLQAVTAGATTMVGACFGYYGVTGAVGFLGAGALPVAIVWLGAGIATGPALAWSGWHARRGRDLRRHLGSAAIAGVVGSESAWLGFVLGHHVEAVVFGAITMIAAVALSRHRAEDFPRLWWLPLPLTPVVATVVFAAKSLVLDTLLA